MWVRLDLKMTAAIAGAALVAVIATGCGDSSDSGADTTTPVPRAAAPTSIPTGEPGISAIEAIVNAAEGGDLEALRTFVRYTPTACGAQQDGVGGPPLCRDSETPGTLVNVIALAQCEGFFAREDELRLDGLARGSLAFLDAYAAPDGFFPAGETVLLFAQDDRDLGETGIELVLGGGAIVGVNFGCAQSPDEMIESQDLDEPIDVGVEGAEMRAMRAIIAAAEGRELDTLESLITFTPKACEVDVIGEGAGPPRCREGEPDGTLIDVAWVSACEGHWGRTDEPLLDPLRESDLEFRGLYAATVLVNPPESSDYVALFNRTVPGAQIPETGVALMIEDGRIVGIHYGCGVTVEDFVTLYELADAIPLSTPDSALQ
jgi:hypothetical protein